MYISLVVILGMLGICLAAKVPEEFHVEADTETKNNTITETDSETELDLDENLENTTINNYLYGEVIDRNSSNSGNSDTQFPTIDSANYTSSEYENQTSTSSYTNQNLSTTTEEELQYLVYDYDYMDREVNIIF